MAILFPEVCYFSVHKLSSVILFTEATFLKHYLKPMWAYPIQTQQHKGQNKKMSKALFALPIFPVTTVHKSQKLGEFYYRIGLQIRKTSLPKTMHTHALKF